MFNFCIACTYILYVACPKSPVTRAFYSERIAGTNNSYSCRIIGHIGTYFTAQNDTNVNDLTATVTLVTMSRLTGAGQIMQNVFVISIFRCLPNQHRYNVII